MFIIYIKFGIEIKYVEFWLPFQVLHKGRAGNNSYLYTNEVGGIECIWFVRKGFQKASNHDVIYLMLFVH